MDNSINISDYKSKQREITDNDLLSIFMGLVKLIKRKVANDFEQNEKVDKGFLLDRISYLENEIKDKDRKIEELQSVVTKKGRGNKRKSQLKLMIDKLSKYKVGKQLVN